MRFFLLFCILCPTLAFADAVEDRINAISARVGLPAMESPSANPVNDPMTPMIDEVDIGVPIPTGKVDWEPNYRMRDVSYLGQWITVFVGEGFATPVFFPKPIASIKVMRQEELGLSNMFKAGLKSYNFVALSSEVNTQVIVQAKDGSQYFLLVKDGSAPEAHGSIDAGGVRIVERRDSPKEGIDLDELAAWENYGAGMLSTRQRMERLLIAMYKKEKVSGYTVLNFKGKVVARDPMMQFHLIRVWHKADAKHPMDGIEYWIQNRSDSPISIIPQMLKKALVVDGDFAIHYEKDTILPRDYMPVFVVQRMAEGKKPLEEVPTDLNLMADDVLTEIKAKHRAKRKVKGQR